MTDLNIFYLSITTYMILSAVVVIMLRIQIDKSKKELRRQSMASQDMLDKVGLQLIEEKDKNKILQDELKYFEQSEKELQTFIIHLKEKLHKAKRKK